MTPAELLTVWGDLARGTVGPTGYPSETSEGRIRRLGPNGAAIRGEYPPTWPAEIVEVDRCVASMVPRYRRVVKAIYLRGQPQEALALEYSTSRRTVQAWIAGAHGYLGGWMAAAPKDREFDIDRRAR